MFWKYAANLQQNTHVECDSNKVIKQIYWNGTSAWVFSCKFAAYFQNTFPKNTSELLLMNLSQSLYHNFCYDLHIINTSKPSSTFTYLRWNLQSLHLPLQSPSARFSVRLDSEFSINLRLLTSHILHTTVLVFSLSFCTGTKNVLYFSIIPPEHSNYPSSSSGSSLITE